MGGPRIVIGAQAPAPAPLSLAVQRALLALGARSPSVTLTDTADWQARISAPGVIWAENWSAYANVTEASQSPGFWGSNHAPGSGNFNTMFQITEEHGVSGKALRVWWKNGIGSGNWVLMAGGNVSNLAANYFQRLYVQMVVWVDDFANFPWKESGGAQGTPKLCIVDYHSSSSNPGELVLTSQNCRGFVTAYTRHTNGSSNGLYRDRATPGNSGNIQWQNAIDRGTPTVVTDNDAQKRYGPFAFGLSGSLDAGVLLSNQGTPDADAVIGGAHWNRGGWIVVEMEVQLNPNRARYWWAPLDLQTPVDPILVGDTDLQTDGLVAFGNRVDDNTPFGTGWSGLHLTTFITNAADPQTNLPANTYWDFAEIIFSEQPIKFPGGFMPPGASDLAVLAAGMASGDWSNFTIGGFTASILTVASSSVPSAGTFCAKMCWDAPRRLVKFTNCSHTGGTTLADAGLWLQWSDDDNQITRVNYTGDSDDEGHVYYHQTVDRNGNSYRRYFHSAQIAKLAVGQTAQNQWALGVVANHPNPANQDAGGLEWFPELNGGAGGLVFCDAEGAAYSNAAMTSWTQSGAAPSGNYHNWSAKSGAFVYFGGGNNDARMYRINASGTTASRASTPISNVGPNNMNAIVLPHPNGTDLLMFETTANGRVWRYTESSNTWSQVANHAIADTPQFFGVTIPEYGVIMFFVHAGNGSGSAYVRVFKP